MTIRAEISSYLGNTLDLDELLELVVKPLVRSFKFNCRRIKKHQSKSIMRRAVCCSIVTEMFARLLFKTNLNMRDMGQAAQISHHQPRQTWLCYHSQVAIWRKPENFISLSSLFYTTQNGALSILPQTSPRLQCQSHSTITMPICRRRDTGQTTPHRLEVSWTHSPFISHVNHSTRCVLLVNLSRDQFTAAS